MASWSDVVTFISNTYKFEQLSPTLLKVTFSYADLRTQGVFLEYSQATDDTEWVLVQSPVGKLGEVDLEKALKFISNKVVGGLALIIDEYVAVKDAVPIANLQAEELIEPIRKVTALADTLEEHLSGQDTY